MRRLPTMPAPLSHLLRSPATAAGLGAAAALLVASKPAAWPFWAHDVRWHLVRVAQWHRGILDGVLYPRFLHDVYWGYGGPVMIFYSPLPYVLSEVFSLMGAGPMRALALGAAACFVGAAAGVFLLMRGVLGAPGAFVASAAYSLAPYHLLNAWVRAAYAEMLAMAVLPFLLLAARASAERRGIRPAAGLAAATATMILSHLISAVIFLPLAAAYGARRAASVRPGERARAAARLVSGLALGAGIAAFYWIPAALERAWTRIPETYAASYRPEGHFLTLSQLVETWWGFGWSGPGPDTMSFQIGWVHLGALAAALALCLRGPASVRGEVVFWVVAAAAAAFLVTASSAWFWRHVPLLASVQYPWRLLAVPALGASVCAGALARLAEEHSPAAATLAAAGVVALAILAYTSFAVAQPPRYSDDQFAPEALAAGQATESMWMPRGARPDTSPSARLAAVEGEAEIEILEDRTHGLAARVRASRPASLRARILMYPGWRAELDGAPLAVRADSTGAIVVAVPAGDHDLRLRFGSTPLRSRAAWLSGACVLIAAALLLAPGLRGAAAGAPPPESAAPGARG